MGTGSCPIMSMNVARAVFIPESFGLEIGSLWMGEEDNFGLSIKKRRRGGPLAGPLY